MFLFGPQASSQTQQIVVQVVSGGLQITYTTPSPFFVLWGGKGKIKLKKKKLPISAQLNSCHVSKGKA